MRYFKIISIYLLVFFICGCAVQDRVQQQRAQYTEPPFQIETFDTQIIHHEEVSGDIRLVVAAIVEQMRNEDNTSQYVSFNNRGSHRLTYPAFHFNGFSLTSTLIQNYNCETVNNVNECYLDGFFTFADDFQRTSIDYFNVEYAVHDNSIVIHDSFAVNAPPTIPRLQAYIVPREDFSKVVDRADSYYSFYAGIVSSAHNIVPTDEEQRQHEKLEQMSFFERLRSGVTREREDNVVIIFAMDRLTPNAEFEVQVTESLYSSNSLVTPEYINYQGWRAAIFGGNFAIDRDNFYIKAYYEPAIDIYPDGTERILAGLFTPEKDYEGQKKVQRERMSQQREHTPREGPLSRGESVLDTSDRSDARIIQTRLAELGYYNMIIDGLWGPGSRGALEQFQRSSGLEASGWNLQTQRSLFEGTGR
ncbi:peptidoglycan-binding domain-containing protein [Desulfonatronospira thiodismutans]|nr:peptidoglycan-binding domain-containing protein [Desulfonatronospira thiodismutans]